MEETVKAPDVPADELLRAFDRMCSTLGNISRGFDVDKIDGHDQWAMKKTECGWMIVSGLGGCGAAVSRWNGYVQGDWNLLMLIEAIENVARREQQRDHIYCHKLGEIGPGRPFAMVNYRGVFMRVTGSRLKDDDVHVPIVEIATGDLFYMAKTKPVVLWPGESPQ